MKQTWFALGLLVLAFSHSASAVVTGRLFVSSACARNLPLGRPSTNPDIIRITGVCVGKISSVGADRLFASFRNDGFSVVYRVASHDPETGAVQLKGIGTLKGGVFASHDFAGVDTGTLRLDEDGFPASLIVRNVLGQRQKDIRCPKFVRKLGPSALK